jgi:hypothetical protein
MSLVSDAAAVDAAVPPQRSQPGDSPHSANTVVTPQCIKVGPYRVSYCPICFEPFNEENPAALLPCRHAFHIQCFYAWQERSQKCAVCSAPVDGPSMARLMSAGDVCGSSSCLPETPLSPASPTFPQIAASIGVPAAKLYAPAAAGLNGDHPSGGEKLGFLEVEPACAPSTHTSTCTMVRGDGWMSRVDGCSRVGVQDIPVDRRRGVVAEGLTAERAPSASRTVGGAPTEATGDTAAWLHAARRRCKSMTVSIRHMFSCFRTTQRGRGEGEALDDDA